MFTTLDAFQAAWRMESDATSRLLHALTDASLAQAVTPEGRTIGRLGWHLAQTIPEMMGRTGLRLDGPGEHQPPPPTASAIAAAYDAAAASLAAQVAAGWTDATLAESDDMYGERWPRGATLAALIAHQTHHRGQLTVLMRQAGLPMIGVYGPTREEWAVMGAAPPPV